VCVFQREGEGVIERERERREERERGERYNKERNEREREREREKRHSPKQALHSMIPHIEFTKSPETSLSNPRYKSIQTPIAVGNLFLFSSYKSITYWRWATPSCALPRFGEVRNTHSYSCFRYPSPWHEDGKMCCRLKGRRV
jgi:hypothetical protein